jgi:Fibronectin type III domain
MASNGGRMIGRVGKDSFFCIMKTEAWVVRTKWIFLFFLVFLILSAIACRTTENRRAEITCRPSAVSLSSAVESGAITIGWDPNKESGLAGYRVYYGTSAGSYNSCVDVGNPPKSSSGLIEYTLTALDKGKKYYIAVIAYDKNLNTSGFSSEVSDMAK